MLMNFRAALVAVAALCAPMLATAETMRVGKTDITLPVDAGYVSARENAPQVYDRMKATLGGSRIRIADAYLTAADAEQVKAGMSLHGTFYVFATLEQLENAQVDARDWSFGRRVIARSLGLTDPNAEIKGADKRLSEHVSKEVGADVKVELGKVDKPVVYGDDPESVRFSMTLPVQTTVQGESDRTVLGVDGAIAHVREKVVLVYVYRLRHDEEDARITRETLASLLTRLQAANR